MSISCTTPVTFDELVDYSAGDLPPDREAAVEEHFFACDLCARRLDRVAAIGRGVAVLLRQGAARGSVTRDVVERAEHLGLTLREYVLPPGGAVQCTAAPDDDFVVVQLEGDFGEAGSAKLDVEMEDLSGGDQSTRHTADVVVDREQKTITLLFPGNIVRAYPKSRWTMHVSVGEEPSRRFGAYVMNHTPWGELGHGHGG